MQKKPDLKFIPATPADIHWIAELEKKIYTPTDAIPETKLTEWYQSNPNGFLLLLANNQPIGHIDVLPVDLDEYWFNRFREGNIREIDLPAYAICPPEKKSLVRAIYVESVIINPPREIFNFKDATPLKYLLANVIPILETISDCQNIEGVFAIAATKSGDHLLRALGFRIVSKAEERIDGHNLYGVDPPTMIAQIKQWLDPLSIKKKHEFERLLRNSAKSGL